MILKNFKAKQTPLKKKFSLKTSVSAPAPEFPPSDLHYGFLDSGNKTFPKISVSVCVFHILLVLPLKNPA